MSLTKGILPKPRERRASWRQRWGTGLKGYYVRLRQRELRVYQPLRAQNPAMRYPHLQQVNMKKYPGELVFHSTNKNYCASHDSSTAYCINPSKSLHQRCAPQRCSFGHHGRDHVSQLEEFPGEEESGKTGGTLPPKTTKRSRRERKREPRPATRQRGGGKGRHHTKTSRGL